MSQYVPMLERGATMVAQSRELIAQAEATISASRSLRVELEDILRLRQFPRGTQHRHGRAQVTSSAEQLIDMHGRWSRHVALASAARHACAENTDAETFWQAVLVRIIDIQVTPD